MSGPGRGFSRSYVFVKSAQLVLTRTWLRARQLSTCSVPCSSCQGAVGRVGALPLRRELGFGHFWVQGPALDWLQDPHHHWWAKAHEDLASFGSCRAGSAHQSGPLRAKQHPLTNTACVTGQPRASGPVGTPGLVKPRSVHETQPLGSPLGTCILPCGGVWWFQTNWQDKHLCSPSINYHKTLTQRRNHRQKK